MTIKTAQDVLDFWFSPQMEPMWFAKSDDVDAQIRDQFAATYEAAHRREFDDWAETAEGALALVIVLDQFPRGLFAGTPAAYACDPDALGWAF